MTHPFGDLQELRERPIPDLAAGRQKRQGYRDHPLDLTGPANTEPLVDITTLGIEGVNYFIHDRNPPYYEAFPGAVAELKLRRSVAEKLQKVDRRLRAHGLKLWVYDAWRPTAVQAYAHDVWMPAQLRKRDPDLTGAALTAEVETYWAAPTVYETSPSPHLTGAAVDLTLAGLYMGSIVEEVSPLGRTDHYEAFDDGSYSAAEARANRRLLYWVMAEAGFANQPNEWWHYSWGDQLWARLSGADIAVYGAAD